MTIKKTKLYYCYLLLLVITSLACTNNTVKEDNTPETLETDATAISFPEKAKALTIYEVNIRQYTPEGTLKAFIPHLDRLEKMGVGILWLMPVQPIGVEKRKGGLGSYYSIKDYTAVNPEFGTLEDFKALVNAAHDKGIYVILDWVANHTSWDHKWMTEHNDFYTKDSLGNVIPPVKDWQDVADLNYENEALRTSMIEAMKFWVTEADIDGFRCDVAGMVPMDFWNKAKKSFDEVKDLFMLAEWDKPEMHKDAFHMTYGWGFHHITNHIAKGEANADSIEVFLKKDLEKFGKEAFRMNFTTNHDENSWNGTVFERYGEGAKAFAVLVSTVQGMPLIYSGQEAGLNKRLKFFEKDEIDWSDLSMQKLYTKLISLKKENKALWSGEYGGSVTRISDDNPGVFAFYRQQEDNKVTVLINLTDKSQEFEITDSSVFGTHKDIFTDVETEIIEGKKSTLSPWEYKVFTN